MPGVSVIMSAYNTEKYVGKAIESILNQTFQDYEFLIVDNGATDKTGEIIDSYAEQDKRIRVFHNEKNKEVAEAWNMALDSAAGKFLYVIDSDDWAEPTLLETMYERAIDFHAQLVYTGFYMDHDVNGQKYSFIVVPDDGDYDQKSFRARAVDDLVRMILSVPWNKLYDIGYLQEHGLRFPITKMPDHHLNMDVMMDVERVSSIGLPLYHYIKVRQGSYMTNNPYLNQKKRELFEHTLSVFEHWGVTDEETMGKLAEHHLGDLVRCVTETVTSNNTRAYKRKELRTILNDKWTAFAIEHRPGGWKATLFSMLFRFRSVCLCYAAGWSIFYFQHWFPRLFYKLRADVAQKAAGAGTFADA